MLAKFKHNDHVMKSGSHAIKPKTMPGKDVMKIKIEEVSLFDGASTLINSLHDLESDLGRPDKFRSSLGFRTG